MSVLEIILLVLACALAAAVVVLWCRFVLIRRRHRNLSEQLNILIQERPVLAEMARLKGDEEAYQLIRDRYDLVSELLAAGVSGDADRSDAVLDRVAQLVADPAEFMRQIRLVYALMQPLMMARLREGGLSDREIEICCLYALGLNGKTIQQYTRDGRHFQNVSVIRKKLGLGEHDKNIDGYIRSLLR